MVDVVLWRAAFPSNGTLRLLLRLVIFALLSALLFESALSPFTPAPWPESPGRHLAAQILEVSWWLLGARLLTMSLDAAFQSRQWHKDRLFQDVLGALVFLAAVVASLAFVLGLPVTGLVATSGALAIVVGLAIQSTLSDVFAGIVLNTTEPYHIGDWVSVDGVDGKVLEMNWRATHLLTSQGNVVIVPNSVAAKAKITNSSRPVALHGVSVALQISPEERPATVLGALERAVAGSNMVLQTPAPYALIKKASIDSIEYEVTVYIDDMGKSVVVTNQLYDLCHRHLAAAGIELWPLSVPRPPRHDGADSRQQLLSHIDLFRALQGEEIEALSRRLSRHEYEANQEVVKSEEVMGPSGPVESARLGPGDSIGEAGVLAGLPVQAQVTALTRAVIYQLDKADLTPLLKSRPEIGQQMCHLLSQQQDSLRKLNTEIPVPVDGERTLLDWLRDGMRKLHELTS